MKLFLCLLAIIATTSAGVLSGGRSSGSGSPQTILVRKVSAPTQENLVIEEEPSSADQAIQTIVIRAGPEAAALEESEQKGQAVKTIKILQSEDSAGSSSSSHSNSGGQSIQIIGGGHLSEDEELIKLILKADARS